MESFALTGVERKELGKKGSKNLRKEGHVPCVIYGGADQIYFHAKETLFNKLIYTPKVFTVDIDVEGKNYKAILKQVQYHPVTDKAIHADFVELKEGEPVTMRIPIKIIGDSPGVMQGGGLVVKLRGIRVRGKYEDLPDNIEVNISNVNLGESIKVADLVYEGLEFLDPANSVVLAVKVSRVAMSALKDEADAAEAAASAETAEGEEGEAKAEGGDAESGESEGDGEAKAEEGGGE